MVVKVMVMIIKLGKYDSCVRTHFGAHSLVKNSNSDTLVSLWCYFFLYFAFLNFI